MFRSKPIDANDPNSPAIIHEVRPYGLILRVSTEIPSAPLTSEDFEGVEIVQPDSYLYRGFLEGYCADGILHSSQIEFSLPRCDKDGFFRVAGTLYCFPYMGFPDSWRPFDLGAYYFLSKPEVAIRALEEAFIGACSGFYFNSRPGSTHSGAYSLREKMNASTSRR